NDVLLLCNNTFKVYPKNSKQYKQALKIEKYANSKSFAFLLFCFLPFYRHSLSLFEPHLWYAWIALCYAKKHNPMEKQVVTQKEEETQATEHKDASNEKDNCIASLSGLRLAKRGNYELLDDY
ncbi:hypothetical protein RFI_36430, partial [Reticulomyxa filosa]